MDKKIIERIVQLTRELTPIPEMAILLDMSEGQLRAIIDNPENPEYRIFRKALAETANFVRQKDIELYNAGSPSAASAVAGHLQKMMASV